VEEGGGGGEGEEGGVVSVVREKWDLQRNLTKGAAERESMLSACQIGLRAGRGRGKVRVSGRS
jgi:hypothetical protein